MQAQPMTPPPAGRFNGSDYTQQDDDRLRGQQLRVWNAVKDGQFRSLGDIAAKTGDPEASISAQLRHLRKPRFGGYVVEKKYMGNGLYHYRVTAPESKQ